MTSRIIKTTLLLFSLSILNNNNNNRANGQQQQHQIFGGLNNLVNFQQDQPPPNNRILSAITHSPRQVVGAVESLPLTRQQQLFQQDLDNVIESTTARLSTTFQQQQQQHQLANNNNDNACQLPPTWAGKWYQANKEPIRVTNTEISDKGVCRDKKGDKYLFESQQQGAYKVQNNNGVTGGGSTTNNVLQSQTCLICLVINERHLNVLQYKESSCQPIPTQYLNDNQTLIIPDDNDHTLLDSICSDITGDAQLESLFRLDTPAIECPINGKYHFTYDNCRQPTSSLDSCIDKKQLNFKFSACPEVSGSESKSEVLKCYADWSEGNNYYMIGRLDYATNHQDKGKFRCFLYEKSADGSSIAMAQSLDESCEGLITAQEGPKLFRLSAKPPTSNKCHFPSFIHGKSENWLSVDNSLVYMFNQNSTKYQVKETKEGTVIEEATCLQQFIHQQQHPHTTSSQQQQQQHYQQATVTRSHQQQVTTTSSTPTTSRRYPPSSAYFNQVDQSYQVAPTATSRSSSSSPSSTLNDVVYLVQITKNCFTTDYCVRFYRRTSGIVQIDYFAALPAIDGQQRCRNAYIGTPQTQIITSTSIEQQRCPFDGAYTIEAPLESDFSYNPSNIFICPRQSVMTAQCDHPTRMRIHYKCPPAKYMIKNLYCLGSWTTNGLVRLILTDDERQRYSAWYRDYANLPAYQDDPVTTTIQPQALTRSQQLLGLSSSSSNQMMPVNPIASIVDLQIALITPIPTMSKPMQVRLTRRNQCSDLRGYSSLGSFSSPMSVPSYAAPSASSSATASSSVIFHATFNSYICCCPTFVVTILVATMFLTLQSIVLTTRKY